MVDRTDLNRGEFESWFYLLLGVAFRQINFFFLSFKFLFFLKIGIIVSSLQIVGRLNVMPPVNVLSQANIGHGSVTCRHCY